MLKKMMAPIDWLCNKLLRPVKNVIKGIVERMNPFANNPLVKSTLSKNCAPELIVPGKISNFK